MSDVYLILENNVVFKGRSFGYSCEAVGELVFSTGMTGYMETLADPVYYGQIVLQTFPLIGNYGVIPNDFGSGPIHLKAYIVRDWCQDPSNFRSEGNLDSFLSDKKIPGLCGVDTRALTRIIRDYGTMNAMISNTPDLSAEQWAALRGYKVANAVAAVSKSRIEASRPGAVRLLSTTASSSAGPACNADASRLLQAPPEPSAGSSGSGVGGNGYNVALQDFGDAFKYIDGLEANGCSPTVVSYDTTADEILSAKPDGIVLSGGPGDPAENTQLIAEIKKLSGSGVPILAIGLGHQMLALARGAKIIKLPSGHRGSNQPVSVPGTLRVFATAQNHGYAVDPDSLPDCAAVSYVNSNDGTCEGVKYEDIPAFSVQFSPTDEVFKEYASLLRQRR